VIQGFLMLLACQLAGEVLARAFDLPAPGPVLGLALLTLALVARRRWRPFSDEALAASDLGKVAAGLLGALSLLFVPAGVGVVPYAGLLADHALALGAALVVSTVATLLVTVFVFIAVKRWLGPDREAAR